MQRVGSSTLSVSLPKDWTRDHGLAKGDILLLDALQDGSLRVVPQHVASAEEDDDVPTVVDADRIEDPGLLGRVVVGNYILGRNALSIRSQTRLPHEMREEVRSAVGKLLGMGIMEETTGTMELQVSLDPSRFPIETVLKRLYTLGSTLRQDAVEALARGDADLARNAIPREDEADQMYWLTIRLLLEAQRDGELAERIGLSEQLPIVGNRLIARSLEQVADHAEQVALDAANLLEEGSGVPPEVMKQVATLSETAGEVVEDALSSIFLHDIHLANEAILRAEAVEELEEALLRSVSRQAGSAGTVAALRGITWSLRRMAEYGEEIAVIGINRYLEHPSDLCHPQEPSGPGDR